MNVMTDKIQKFVNRIYAPLGKFIVDFENLCQSMRIVCIKAFAKNGLQKGELAEITFAGLTASPLLDVYVSLTSEAFTLDASQMEELKQIKKRTQSLITTRNKAIHSKWTLFDFADLDDGAPEGLLVSNKRKHFGLDRQIQSLSREELMRLSEETIEITGCIETLSKTLIENA